MNVPRYNTLTIAIAIALHGLDNRYVQHMLRVNAAARACA